MYRLLCVKSISHNNFKVLSLKNYINITNDGKCFRKTFTISRNHDDLLNESKKENPLNEQIREQSTIAEISQMIKKKRKRKVKKFTELLQVADGSTMETRTAVQKLKAGQLSDFINSKSLPHSQMIEHNSKYYGIDRYDTVDVNNKIYDEIPVLMIGANADISRYTSNCETIKEIIDSCQTFKEMSIVESEIDIPLSKSLISPLAAEDSCHYLEEDLIDPLAEGEAIYGTELTKKMTNAVTDKKANGKKLNVYKSKYHKTLEQEKLSKQHTFNSNLRAYLEICVNCGMVNRGYGALLNYRYKSKKPNSTYHKIRDINLYNILLHGYAEKGNLSKAREIMNILKEDKIDPIPQTYAAVFECIERLQDSAENAKLLQKYYAEMLTKGIKLNDLLDKCEFVSDQREIVLDAIEKIDPKFQPRYTPAIITYNNVLMNQLNSDIQPLGSELEKQKEASNSKIMTAKRGFTSTELVAMGKDQLNIELDGFVQIKSIANFTEPTELVLRYRQKLNETQELWKSQICAAITRDMNTLRHQTNSKSSRSINIYPYLKSLDATQYVDILLHEIRALADGSDTYSPTVGQLYRDLGLKAQLKCQIERKKKNGVLEKTCELFDSYCEKLSECHENDNPRQSWQRLMYDNQHYGPSLDKPDTSWPPSVMIGVGRFLYNILMRDLKIDVNIIRSNCKNQNFMSAFYTLFRNQGRLVKEEVKPHPVLSRLYRGSQQEMLLFDANMVPMLCPPQPWTSPHTGGYLVTKSDLIRLPYQAIQQIRRIQDAPPQDLYPALDSLNQLASIPWKVNTQLLDVILDVFKKGGNSKLDVPQPPSSLAPIDTPTNSLSSKDKFQLYRLKLYHRRKQAEMYSLWCDALYRLSLANHYRDKVFWLPHNMDFRGRVYPIPPHLNHLGSDLARSLLIFHQPQKLGPDGLKWLKLHCINLTGLKKRDSIAQRLIYADEILDDILDSAANPLDGRMWWTKSDEPWQTLGCCMEIAKVIESGDPENYMSSFPIHQDGSCNGLQHYAALGRDTAGAISVNLAPSNVPQDVYSSVATLVEDARQKDATNGIEIAKILEGFVKRKVIKQTVMTTVYGVTRYGARLQIARQLKDIDEFPKDWVWAASSYLTTKTFESLREMFTSTKEIQDWFTDCARLISTVCGQNVEWITPLGLPVVQPYNRQEKKSIPKTHNGTEYISTDLYEKPNIMKQKNAFPPNFIHSLDSSHMMLTSLYCEKAGITFISVHDCFWTHACTVADMNKICREQFVALHSQPILDDLSTFLVQKYSYSDKELLTDGSVSDLSRRKLNKILTEMPDTGDFDLNNILKSIYFFS